MQNMQAPLGGTVGASITIKIKKKIVKLVESKTAVAKKSKRVLL